MADRGAVMASGGGSKRRDYSHYPTAEDDMDGAEDVLSYGSQRQGTRERHRQYALRLGVQSDVNELGKADELDSPQSPPHMQFDSR
jgi:hypothetical protein